MFSKDKMNLMNLNIVNAKNRLKSLFLLGMIFCFGMSNAATYFLTSAGAGSAQTPGSWNTDTVTAAPATALTSWSASGTSHTYVVPSGRTGTWGGGATTDIGADDNVNQSFIFVINGRLTINDASVLRFQGQDNRVTWTTNGTLTIGDNGDDETFKTQNQFPTGRGYFKFSSGATLIVNNNNGISGVGNSAFGTNSDFVFLHDRGANYTFINTANTTNTNGLNDTLNNLTISTTNRTCNTLGVLAVKGTLSITVGTGSFALAANTTVEGSISITSGTLAIGTRTLTLISGSTFTHSAGSVTISTGTFAINGTYTHSSGTFTISGAGSVTVGSTGTLALNSGVFNMLARTLTIAGNVTRTSGSIHFTSGSGTVTFTNTTAKTLPSDVFLVYPANFTLNGAGGITLGGNTRTRATDSLPTLTLTNGILKLSAGKTAISTLNRTIGSIAGNSTANLIFYGPDETLFMDQTSPGTTNLLGEITLNGTTDLTLGSNLVVETSLIINERTLNLSSFTLTKNGNYTKSTGTIQISTGDFIVTGLYTHTSSGTLTFSTGSVMTVGSMAMTSGTINFTNGLLNVTGLYTHTSSGTLTFGSSTLSVGSLEMTSGEINVSTGILSIGGAVSRAAGQISAPGGTVRFTNTSAVTLPNGTFSRYPANFILNGVGGVTLGGRIGSPTNDTLQALTLTSGNLTLRPGAFTTAISSITGTGGNIVGNDLATLVFFGSTTNTLRMDQTTPGTTNAVSVLTVNNVTNNNLTLGSNLDVKTTLTLNARTLNLGSFTLTKTGTFTNFPTATIQLSTGTLNVSDAYTHVTAGTLTFGSGTLAVGSLVLTSGTINVSTGILSIGGTVSRTTGQISAPGGTVRFTNTSAVTLPNGTFIIYPANFILNGAGGVTLGGRNGLPTNDTLRALTLTSGNLTLRPGAFTTAISSITGTGGNIVGNTSATVAFFGNTTNTLRMDQTIPGTTNAVSVLTLNGTSNVTLGSNLDVKTTLTLNARTLNVGSFTLTKTGTFTNGTATVQLSSGAFNISGAYTHVNTGTLTFGSGTLAVGSLVMTSGNINVSTGILSIGGTVSRTSGQIHAPLGTVRFKNSSAITLPSNTFVTYPANFILEGSGGVTLGGKTGTLKDSLGNLTFTSGNLTITTDTTCIGSITGSGGSIVGNTSSTVRFYGSNSSTLRTSQTTPGTSNAVKNLLLTGSSNVTLGTATRIAANGLVNIPSSTTLNTGGLLTIVSNATGHGRVGTVGGTFTSSSTDSIQLFIPGGERGYRLFGNPFTSALAISQFMDNATEIDVTGAGGSGNGFTNTINNNPSAYSYNTTGNSWSAFTNTSQTIGIGTGAHILVRGVKGEGLNGAVYTPSASTIRLAGQFRTGNVVTSLSDAGFGWNLVANPYPSNIDINQISGGNWVNVNAAIYGYDKVNRTYSAYSKNVGNAVNNLSNIIEMGSSFLAEVTTTGSASITFTEAIKTSASSTVGGNSIFTPKEERLNQFKINLSGEVGSDGNFHDECLLSFDNTSISTPEFDPQSDAWDLGGEMLNVSIITPKNDYLAINEYPSIEKQTEAIPLIVWAKSNGEYTLSYTEVSAVNENTQIWLRDKYKGEVHFIQESPYKFDINDMEESYGANRFELFTVQQSSGLSKTSTKNTLRVFPNPVDINAGKVSIYIPGEGHEYVKTTIYDLSGREVYSSKKVKYETMQTIDLTLPTELSAQTYIMSCETLQGTFVQQIIINNK